MSYSLMGKKVWVAGHRGMVGGAVVRRLDSEECTVLTAGREEVDLCDQSSVQAWMASNRPDCIVLAAAKVGVIHANNVSPVDFLQNNLAIQNNILEAAHLNDVERLLFLGSSCIYPKFASQPIREESLLTGALEPTNEWYAIAKIAGIKLCQAYRKQYGRDWISAMPTNLYGPGDNYDLETSHVLPALLRKFHEAKVLGAKEVVLWGSGSPMREFLHCDDLADALLFLLKNYSEYGHINVGASTEVTIRGLAETIARVVGYEAKLVFDSSKPDGTPRKLMDSRRLHTLGWNNVRPLETGIASTYEQWLSSQT
jgi:GDP-L-fucose synthase